MLKSTNLPDWAKWHASVELSPEPKILILNLKHPRWDHSFYPVFVERGDRPLWAMPSTLSLVASEGRLWFSCPKQIYFSEKTSEVVVETVFEGDHPRPPAASRQLFSPPEFKAKVTESLVGDFERGGGMTPSLSKLSDDFNVRTVVFK